MKISEIPSGLTDFKGKTVLITGSSGGIGRALAAEFSAAGAALALHYFRNQEEAEKIRFQLTENQAQADIFQADLTKQDEVDVLFDSVLGRFGRVDILINNAGIYPPRELIETESRDWDKVLGTDLSAVHLCTRIAVKSMIKQKIRGSVINIASIEAENPAPLHAAYCAAKGGLVSYTRAAALEFGSFGIRVNAVSPGLIDRPGLKDDWPEGIKRYTFGAPLGRIGQPEDVARACLFLASPLADWITGVNLRVDGGIGAVQGY
jgi:NAD(P)-dependent dehydrogenase (short-subunit alcohol dehydrogenase family)